MPRFPKQPANTNQYTIRPVAATDLPELVRLCAAHAEYEKATYNPRGKAERLGELLFSPTPRLHCIVAATLAPKSSAVELVGYTTWSQEVSTWEAATYAHMDCLYLDPTTRGQGLGRLLVQQLARDALTAGCQQVQWQTPAFNQRAIPFYERLGAASKEKVRFFLEAKEMVLLAEHSE